MRVRVRVDIGIAARRSGCVPGADSITRGSSRCGDTRGRGRELGRELAEAEMLAAPVDQPEDRRVPEHRRSAHAEEHLVAVGELEQVGDTDADAPHDRLHALAPVARAEVRRRRRRQRGDGLVADLRRTGSEAPVRRQQLGRESDVRLVSHAPSLPRRWFLEALAFLCHLRGTRPGVRCGPSTA